MTKECSCVKQRAPLRKTRAPLQSITTHVPLELVSIDFLHLERSTGGYEYILVVVDHFTRFAQAYPTRNKEARTAADKLYEFFLKYGFPSRILHDQGREFENKLFHQLEKSCGIIRSRTTPYHPQGNGKAERFNRTLLSMLKTLPEIQKSRWDQHVSKAVHAYNCTRNDATNFSPFFLLFGRSPRLPIDLMFGRNKVADTLNHRDYSEKWSSQMNDAYTLASKHAVKNSLKGKRNYDKGVRYSILKPGDRVLVRNLSEHGGPAKLRAHWEEDIQVVVSRMPDSPVYEVKPEKKDGRKRLLNRLLPYDFLPLTPEPQVKSPTKRVRKRERSTTEPIHSLEQSESDIDEPDVVIYVSPESGNQDEPENDAPEENRVSDQNESDSNSDNERSEIPAAVNTQEPNLDELLDGQVQSEEQVQPVDEPPPLPPTRRSTRVRSAPNPLTYNQLGNPELFVSSVKATSMFQPVTQMP